MIEFLLQLDLEIFLFLNGLNTAWLDPVMYYISEKFFWIPFYMVLLWLCYRYYGWKVVLIMLIIAVMITITDQFTGVMKDFFQRYRPSRDESLGDMVHIVNGRRGGRYGFASAHAANSFALAVFIIFLLKPHVRFIMPVMLIWASMKAYSRIYLGVHYPGDIIVGALVGVLAALLMIKLWQLVLRKYFPDEQQVPVSG